GQLLEFGRHLRIGLHRQTPSPVTSAVASLPDVAQGALDLARRDRPLPEILRLPVGVRAAEAVVVRVPELRGVPGAGCRAGGPGQGGGSVGGTAAGDQ